MSRFSGLSSGKDAISAELGAVLRGGRMLARGYLRKPFFGSSAGPLFVGRGVRLSGLRHIRHEGRLVVEDGVELQGLSAGGLWFGPEHSAASAEAKIFSRAA